jgi:Xaa-Pro aminopeptidase
MTRTYIVGQQPEPWQVDLHAAVERAQRAARERLADGVGKISLDAAELDAVARSSLAVDGLGDRFTHGLGHGVGLQIHEAPFLGPRATGSITAGMTITVEPGAYLPGRGGVRIEDTLAITESGARVLTEASRALEVVGA